jgi:hypothetical protein
MTEDKTQKEEEEAHDTADEPGAPAQPAAAAEIDPLEQLDGNAKAVEAELFPPSDDDPAGPADAGEEGMDEPVRPSDPPETFASAEAPWVGAEKKWLRGGADEPGEQAPAPGERAEAPARAFPMVEVEDDSLLVTPQVPVLPSLIPPPPTGVGLGFKLGILGVLLVVIGGAAAVVYWMSESFSAREQEILALRASDKQDVVRLERQIQDLLARGGAENEARASELQIELRAARQEAAAEADTDTNNEERRHRQRNDSDGAEEPASATIGSTPTASPTATPGMPDRTGPIAPNPYPEDPVEADLLDSAIRKPVAPASAPEPIQGATEFPLGGAELPASPSREQVKAAMDSITPQVRSCGQGGGRIVISLSVAGATGRVTSAEPTGDASGTPLGLCAARAVKLAKFPAFKQDRLQIKYPFDL